MKILDPPLIQQVIETLNYFYKYCFSYLLYTCISKYSKFSQFLMSHKCHLPGSNSSVTIGQYIVTPSPILILSWGHFIKRFVSVFSLTNFISY